jgi:hypothetical protein
MSLEAWGDDGILAGEVTAEDLWDHGWLSDPDAEIWWKQGEPEDTYTFSQAAEIFDQNRWEE